MCKPLDGEERALSMGEGSKAVRISTAVAGFTVYGIDFAGFYFFPTMFVRFMARRYGVSRLITLHEWGRLVGGAVGMDGPCVF